MKEEIAKKISAAVKDLYGIDAAANLSHPDEQFGDYSTNVAMQLAGQLNKNPREIADEVAENLRGFNVITDVTVAGPGFINLRLSDQALIDETSEKPRALLEGKTVLVEYSDPNPFKPLHAGHLYTTLVGDMIARLIENAGAKIIRLNYGGDVGLHVGRSMWAIIRNIGGELPEKLDEVPTAERPQWLGERYVEGTAAYEDDEAAKAEIIACNRRVYEIHNSKDHDSPFARIYWTCRDWSYDYFKVLYEQLRVSPFDRFIPESEVTLLGVKTVQEQLEKGVYEKSDGAIIFNGEKYGLHTRVFINSEGLPVYEAKDVGLSLTKWQDYHFDESVIITANEQEQYMQVVLKSIEQFEPELVKRTKHLTHGVVKLQGGIKMSSRKGNVVTALEILDAARSAGDATGTHPNDETILAAVKYAFAKNRVGGDIIYDPKESVALEGNSGPYLQYAHARARSILSKSETAGSLEGASLDSSERNLLRKINQFTEVIEQATIELMPHHVCTYIYELAQEFNRFYEKNRVIGDPREGVRLELVRLYADRLKAGLSLLGIHAPDHM